MVKKLFIAWLVLDTLCFSSSKAQDCSSTLEQARSGFENGYLYTIPSTLKPCLDNGFDPAQKKEAYLILTRTYLLIDDPISAEDSYLKLLKLDPEYNINADLDPVDIVYLNENFTTTPIFILFAQLGFNSSSASVIQNFGVDNTSLSQETYGSAIGLNFGVGVELNINDHFSLGTELNFYSKNYTYQNILFGNDVQSFDESQSLIEVPLFLKYRMSYKKWRPYAYAGISVNYLLTSEAEVSLVDVIDLGEDGQTEFSVIGPPEDLIDAREALNYNLLAGIGTRFRIGYNYLFFDLRYHYGLNNFVNQAGQYSNPSLLYKYGYVDDLKRMQSVSFSVGFIKPLYKPRKIEKKTGFLSNIFN